jgi:hypothetical protein
LPAAAEVISKFMLLNAAGRRLKVKIKKAEKEV